MLGSVTRLNPRIGSLDTALAAFRSARLSDCVSELHGLDSSAAQALCARAYLRLDDPTRALAVLSRNGGLSFRERAETALLTAASHVRAGQLNEADAAFVDARVYTISCGDSAIEAELDYYAGLYALTDDCKEEAREAIEHGLINASSSSSTGTNTVTVPLPHVVARLHELLVVLHTSEARYGDALTHARLSLEALDGSPMPDVYASAYAVKNLTIFARDFDIPDADVICERANSLPWTRDIRAVQFAAIEATGWCSALRGDVLGSLRRFRAAAAAASTPPEHASVAIARAVIARESGYRQGAAEDVEHALALLQDFDWHRAAGNSRATLLDLAQAAASVASPKAREVLDRYTNIRNAVDARFADRTEARVRAEESFTHGVVLRSEGRLTASTERLRQAFDLWQSIGHEWRAARAAVELAELNAGNVFRLAVRRELHRRPNSVFAERARLVA